MDIIKKKHIKKKMHESAFSLTRMMNDELDRMHTDITPVHTDIQQQGKK